jgi:hypothetical protein
MEKEGAYDINIEYNGKIRFLMKYEEETWCAK